MLMLIIIVLLCNSCIVREEQLIVVSSSISEDTHYKYCYKVKALPIDITFFSNNKYLAGDTIKIVKH